MDCIKMVVTMNPCKCGFYPDRTRCSCLPGEISRYLHRVSWPLLDRIDICVETPRIDYADLVSDGKNESSAQIRSRVEAAQEIQRIRYTGQSWSFNSALPAAAIREFCPLGNNEERIMEAAFERMDLSARGCHRIIRVARTIADLEGEERIRDRHLLEAIGYRSLDQKYWDR